MVKISNWTNSVLISKRDKTGAAAVADVIAAAAQPFLDSVALSAAFAEAFSGRVSADRETGEGLTHPGEVFRIHNGDGTLTPYLRTSSGSIELEPLATTNYLASDAGAAAVGMRDGADVQQAIAVAPDPSTLIASTAPMVVGSGVRTANGYLYKVAAPDATDHHLATAGGVKLYSLSAVVDALGAPANGRDDDAPYFTKALEVFGMAQGRPGATYSWKSFVAVPNQNLYGLKMHRLVGNGATISVDHEKAPLTSAAWAGNQADTRNPFSGKLIVTDWNFVGSAVDGVVDLDHLYNVIMTGCHASGLHKVFTSYRKKTGHANGYIQSLFVIANQFADIGQIIEAKEAYNVVFAQNLCERCRGGIRIDGDITDYAIHNLRISDNLFEGGGQFLRATHTLSGLVSGNYLESNNLGAVVADRTHMNLEYNLAAGGGNPSTWLIEGNSSQDTVSQRNDTLFGMFKINGSYETVTAKGNWADSSVTVSPVRNLEGNYSRRPQKYVLPRTLQQAGADAIGAVLSQPLSYSLIGKNQLQVISMQLADDIVATDFRSVVLNLSMRLQAEVATGEVFGECAFDLKIFLSPIGSGVPAGKGKPSGWDTQAVHSNYMEQSIGVLVDKAAGAETVSLFPAGITGWSFDVSGSILHLRAHGFNPATIPGYGRISNVRTHIVGSINALSKLEGTGAKWISLIN